METKSQTPEKKAYYPPELHSFGSVEEGTEASNVPSAYTDGGTWPIYTTAS